MFGIKLVIIDCDGVLTDGKKVLDRDGNVLSKTFNDKDWSGIKKIKAAGLRVVMLSGDPWNEKIAKNRNIDFYCSKGKGLNGTLDKAMFVKIFEDDYKVRKEEMAYIGDDYFDLDIMREVGFVFCPKDANSDVIEHVMNRSYGLYSANYSPNGTLINSSNPFILDRNGGDGVMDCLYFILNRWGLEAPSEKLVRNIDAMEKQ